MQRVSTREKKNDLETQASVLQGYSEAQGWKNITVIKDFGSGLNYKKRGLRKLIELIESELVERLVLTHKDRLLRFGSELIFALCELHGVSITVINRAPLSSPLLGAGLFHSLLREIESKE